MRLLRRHILPVRDGVFTPSQRFGYGDMAGIAPEFKRLGRVE